MTQLFKESVPIDIMSINKRKATASDSQKKYSQKKYITEIRKKELGHRFIVSMSGYDPNTGRSKDGVRMIPTEEFLALVENLSFDSPLELRQLEAKLKLARGELDYTSLQLGAAASVPIPLMVNLLRDLKDETKKIKGMRWKTISTKDYEGVGGKGKYFMFHWDKSASFSGYEQDWKRNNNMLGTKTQELVDDLACEVIKNF